MAARQPLLSGEGALTEARGSPIMDILSAIALPRRLCTVPAEAVTDASCVVAKRNDV